MQGSSLSRLRTGVACARSNSAQTTRSGYARRSPGDRAMLRRALMLSACLARPVLGRRGRSSRSCCARVTRRSLGVALAHRPHARPVGRSRSAADHETQLRRLVNEVNDGGCIGLIRELQAPHMIKAGIAAGSGHTTSSAAITLTRSTAATDATGRTAALRVPPWPGPFEQSAGVAARRDEHVSAFVGAVALLGGVRAQPAPESASFQPEAPRRARLRQRDAPHEALLMGHDRQAPAVPLQARRPHL